MQINWCIEVIYIFLRFHLRKLEYPIFHFLMIQKNNSHNLLFKVMKHEVIN